MYSLHDVGLYLIKNGFNKVHKPIIKMLVLSIFGGFIIGLSACLASICGNYYIEGYAQFYKGIVFPIGIIIVYCAGGEIITGNCLLSTAFFANKITTLELLLSWLIVLVGNFIGTMLVSLLIAYGHIPNQFNVVLAQIVIVNGNTICGKNFGEAFIQGMLANFFNCLGIWVAMVGKEMRSVILALFIPNFLIMALDLDHCVADMYYILVGIFTSYEYGLDTTDMGWGKLFYKNIIPVFLGSLVGGGLLVGVLYWYIFINKDDSGYGRDKIKITETTINNSLQKVFEQNNYTQNKNPDMSSLKMLDN